MAAAAPLAPNPQAREVLVFWLKDGLESGWPSQNQNALWWGGGPSLDRDIDRRFGDLVRAATEGGLADWEGTPATRLALVLLLDQFTRNVFRGRPEAFKGDTRAQALVLDTLAQAWDRELPLAGRVFLHMPLVHSELIALQDKAVAGFEAIQAGAPAEYKPDVEGFVKSAREHRDIIAQFGRFPHRNAVLGRNNSAREQDFLQHGPRFGQ